jgi:hypothetical protein
MRQVLIGCLVISSLSAFGAEYDLQGWLEYRKNYQENRNKPFNVKTEIMRFKRLDLNGDGTMTNEERLEGLKLEKSGRR